MISPSGFSVGTLFTENSDTAKNFSIGAGQPVVEWYSAEQVKELESETVRLRRIIKAIHDNLEYGDVFGWDGGESHWNEMRKIAEE